MVEPPATFVVSEIRGATQTVLAVAGELDLFTTPRLTAALELLAEERRAIVLDLSDLAFMDSTGLAVVLRFHKVAEEGGFPFGVVRGPEAVDRVFRITRTDELLTMLDAPPAE